MPNIGEQLEEARKRKGVSIREAAEATKIRGDFLAAFESNQFGEVTLPEIYKRGFIKIYSNFLKLDAEKVLADYTAHQLGNSRLARKDGREFLGRIELPSSRQRQKEGTRAPVAPEEPTRTPEPATQPAPDTPAENPRGGDAPAFNFRDQPEEEPEPRRSRFSSDDRDSSPFGGDKTLYWKIGLAGGGAFVLFLLIFALFKAITSGPSDPGETRINETRSDTRTTERTTPTPATGSEVILVGTGEVFVQVKQLDNGEILYSGTLSQGERVPLRIRGDADIAFTRGSNLQIIKDGETFQPDVSRSELGKVNTRNL